MNHQVNANPSLSLYHTTSQDEPINPVDLAVKQVVVDGALSAVLGHHSDGPLYSKVDLPEVGAVWERCMLTCCWMLMSCEGTSSCTVSGSEQGKR